MLPSAWLPSAQPGGCLRLLLVESEFVVDQVAVPVHDAEAGLHQHPLRGDVVVIGVGGDAAHVRMRAAELDEFVYRFGRVSEAPAVRYETVADGDLLPHVRRTVEADGAYSGVVCAAVDAVTGERPDVERSQALVRA